MSCIDLWPVEENTDGKCCARSSRAPGCHHPGPEDERRREVHNRPGCVRIRQHLEAAVLYEGWRRLLSAPGAVGHWQQEVDEVSRCRYGRGLVDGILSFGQ